MNKEVMALKESLEIARSRNGWLEKQSKDVMEELEELRQVPTVPSTKINSNLEL